MSFRQWSTWCLVASIWILQAIASPLPDSTELHPKKPPVPCDNIAKYTTEFFLQNRVFSPLPSSSLFYTEKQGSFAKAMAQASNYVLITIWDVWTCDLYNEKNSVDDSQNKLRCIMDDIVMRRTYFENMSRAYAQLSFISASVVTPDVNNLPSSGIWGRIEQPTLQRATDFADPKGKTDVIFAISTTGQTQIELWRRPGTVRPRGAPELVPSKPKGMPDCVKIEDVDTRFGFLDW